MLCLVICLLLFTSQADAFLAGGRPNSFSGGLNAFAGIANPANAAWIPDRWDIGFYWINQRSSFHNYDNNPGFPPGTTDTTYHRKNIFTYDAAITKQIKKPFEGSMGLAFYYAPNPTDIRTKEPIPLFGTTPWQVRKRTKVLSAIFSVKLGKNHSVGISVDYFFLSYDRQGNQNAATPERSVSPENVTNRGTDHSGGPGLSLGWHWNITPKLEFGAAWIKKSYVGQFRKYRGYEPHHAKNYIPQSIGGGFGYKFTAKLKGRLEALWTNYGNLPGANNAVLADGEPNTNKRGSDQSPGPGLQDATLINMGLGYLFTPQLAMGVGYSHRIKPARPRDALSHSYRFQTIFDLITFGTYYKYKKNDFLLTLTRGFKNKPSGELPAEIGGGRFAAEKDYFTAFFSWGYLF